MEGLNSFIFCVFVLFLYFRYNVTDALKFVGIERDVDFALRRSITEHKTHALYIKACKEHSYAQLICLLL